MVRLIQLPSMALRALFFSISFTLLTSSGVGSTLPCCLPSGFIVVVLLKLLTLPDTTTSSTGDSVLPALAVGEDGDPPPLLPMPFAGVIALSGLRILPPFETSSSSPSSSWCEGDPKKSEISYEKQNTGEKK